MGNNAKRINPVQQEKQKMKGMNVILRKGSSSTYLMGEGEKKGGGGACRYMGKTTWKNNPRHSIVAHLQDECEKDSKKGGKKGGR